MAHNMTTPYLSYHFSPRATLAAVGIRLQGLNLFGPVRDQVHIDQKTIQYTPVQKLYDAFIAILAGAHGLVEINKRRRADPGLHTAFGRLECAEQSVVQDTLDACTEANVEQMHHAMDTIYRRHSRGYRHDYAQRLQVLDVDMSGLPCGKKAAFAYGSIPPVSVAVWNAPHPMAHLGHPRPRPPAGDESGHAGSPPAESATRS